MNRHIKSLYSWARNYAKGGPKKQYSAEQLAAMLKAQRDMELAGFNPMSSAYNGPAISPASTTAKSVPYTQTQAGVKTTALVAERQKAIQNAAEAEAKMHGYNSAAEYNAAKQAAEKIDEEHPTIRAASETPTTSMNALQYNMLKYGYSTVNPLMTFSNYDFDRDRLALEWSRQQQAQNWENKYNRNRGMDNVVIPAMEFSPMFPWIEGAKAFKSASQGNWGETAFHGGMAMLPVVFKGFRYVNNHLPYLQYAKFKPVNKITNNQLSNVVKIASPPNNTWVDFMKKVKIHNIVDSDIHSLPKYNLYDEGIDFTNRKLSNDIVDEAYQQIIPRLENDPFRQQLIVSKIKPPEFVKQNFDDLVDKASVVEWSKRLFDDYHELFNSNVGGYALADRPRIIVPKKDFYRPNRNPLTKEIIELHELRHLLQKQFPRTGSEEQILKEAYKDAPQPLNQDGTIDKKYDMTKEWETMNSEGRKLLLDASNYIYDPTKTTMENIAIQNKIIAGYDPRTMLTILKENGSGYWGQFITTTAKKKLPPAQQLDYINKWKKAMQAVGMFTGVNAIIVNNLDDVYANGGPIHIKPENRGKFTAAANRAGKSVQEYARQILAHKENYSSTLVKRANFARNAKKFHH